MLEIGEPRQLVVPCVQCGDNKIIMARQVTKEEVERNPAFAEFLQVSRSNSPNDRRASRVSSRSRSSVCRHRGTPGHKCGQRYTFKKAVIIIIITIFQSNTDKCRPKKAKI